MAVTHSRYSNVYNMTAVGDTLEGIWWIEHIKWVYDGVGASDTLVFVDVDGVEVVNEVANSEPSIVIPVKAHIKDLKIDTIAGGKAVIYISLTK